MRPRELRIGNIVKCTGHLPIGFNSHKSLFTEIRELRYESVETAVGFYKYSNIVPVELDEEILLKCEFEHEKNDTENSIFYSKSDFVVYKTDEGFGIDFGEKEWDFFRKFRIKYLHELQNIYFDFTGRELYVNLPKVK
ncbi:MAG: hypothetical protein LBQ22_03210 [Bacteroidales bacterium]|jgi:hypothetical protein|nr:hypothetical protein [Bacteroidales bacterium]